MSRNFRQSILYIFSDLASSMLAWLLMGILRGELMNAAGEWDRFVFISAFIVALGWVLAYSIAGLYQNPLRKSRFQELGQVFRYTLFGVLFLFFVIVLDSSDRPYHSYRIWFSTYLFLQFGFVAFIRFLITTRTNVKIRKGTLGFPTLIIGCEEQALSIYKELAKQRKSLGYHIKGYVCLSGAKNSKMPGELNDLGNIEDLSELIPKQGIEEIIIALEKEQSEHIGIVIEKCETHPVHIKIVPGIYDYIVGSVKSSHILGAALIEIFPQIMRPWQKIAKRSFDVLASIIALIVISPILCVVAILIKIDSKGSFLFKQERIGKNGKPFFIYKFRSMYVNAEAKGPALSGDNDPRITPIGIYLRKLRLDELPQFWNVVKGEMSIVGPRPERQFFIDQIVQKAPHYRHLHKVRPGITSWGQVKYGYASNVEEMVERLKYDILYIEQMSLSLDIKIILYTFIVIIEGRGK